MTDKVVRQINESTPIFSCICDEPGGSIERFVYPMVLSPQNVQRFWELSAQFKILFGSEISGNFQKFCSVLMSENNGVVSSNGLFWRMDDFVGIFYVTNIQENDAQIHYSFFDRRARGRVAIARKMIRYVFDKYEFHRLSSEIPYYANAIFPFILDVGLKEEGRKRKVVLYDNEWFDTKLFGVLREEAEQWTL